MKLLGVIIKSLREQVRSVWVLLLSLAMGPFFIFVYYLIVESSKPVYDLLIVNNDAGLSEGGQTINHGKAVIDYFREAQADSLAFPFIAREMADRNYAMEELKNKHADALVIIPETFSAKLRARSANDSTVSIPVEISGDLSNINYLVSAIWANELFSEYLHRATNSLKILEVTETPLGVSGNMNDFDMIVPGILILSLIMLMFTASIAFISEVENKTILRLKLSKLSALEFLGGIGIVQSLVGVVSLVLTLITALLLGFQYAGSLGIMLLIAGLTSLSVIAFSLIIAAVTKSANEVLIVGNFPMFLFMFFTGAAFPLKSEALFTIAGYPVNVQGLMSPVHAISALNKTLVMNMSIRSIIPEITALLTLTVLYYVVGALIFRHRHLRLG